MPLSLQPLGFGHAYQVNPLCPTLQVVLVDYSAQMHFVEAT